MNGNLDEHTFVFEDDLLRMAREDPHQEVADFSLCFIKPGDSIKFVGELLPLRNFKFLENALFGSKEKAIDEKVLVFFGF